MWLVLMALKRPVTILVAVMSIALGSILAIRQMKVDIFPKLGAPAIYVAQPYGGMDPSQMEGYLTYYYEYHFLYITGIEHVESKNIQGVALMKLVFHPETDMSQAMAEVVGYVNRSRAFMPPGAVPPFIMRYDAGSVPVAQLVFSSESRSPGEMQDIALNRVRPDLRNLARRVCASPFRRQPADDRGASGPRANAGLPALTGRSHREDQPGHDGPPVRKCAHRRPPSVCIHQCRAWCQTLPSCWIRRCAWGRGQPSICGISGPLRIAPMSSWATPMWMASARSIFLSPSEQTLPR